MQNLVIRKLVQRFVSNTEGSLAVIGAIMIMVLVSAAGLAVDYGSIISQQGNLQGAADAAAIAAAKELQVSSTKKSQVKAVANHVFQANMGKLSGTATIEVTISKSPLSVTVKAAHPFRKLMMDWSKGKGVSAVAIAKLRSNMSLCVLSLAKKLGKKAVPGIVLMQKAKLTADNCAVYSNAKKKDSIVVLGGAVMKADMICTAGGIKGKLNGMFPRPLTDCPILKDPLASRPEPTVGNCVETNLQIGMVKKFKFSQKLIMANIKAETRDEMGVTGKKKFKEKEKKPINTSHYDRSFVKLYPGTYCGGITIGGGVTVTFQPGVYIMKNGPLYVSEEAIIEGKHVGFFFTGKKSNLYLGPYTSVSLTAPKSTALAGLLFSETRNGKSIMPHAILSDNARLLEGTIYLPRGHLYIDADAPIADKSAYTAIIVSRLELFAGPDLVLNTDFDATDVPVPKGVGNLDSTIYLSQ